MSFSAILDLVLNEVLTVWLHPLASLGKRLVKGVSISVDAVVRTAGSVSRRTRWGHSRNLTAKGELPRSVIEH